MGNFEQTLYRVLKTAGEELSLEILNKDLIEILPGTSGSLLSLDNNHLQLVNSQNLDFLFKSKNQLTDAFIEQADLKSFYRHLLEESRKVTLGHLGFCYQVESKIQEKTRLMGVAKEGRFHLYEMTSNDTAFWLFLGKNQISGSPMIEFLPVEKVEDYYLDYWLPHIHLALHTNLGVNQIKYLTHEAFKGNRSANPTTIINGLTYQLRVWLGTVSGINIVLDLFTNERWNTLEDGRKLLRTLV